MVLKKIALSRALRIERYLDSLEQPSLLLKDKRVTQLVDELTKKISFVKRLQLFQIFLYFGIYFSLVSYLFSYFELFEELVFVLSKIFGFFGTSVLVVLAFLNYKYIELIYQDISLHLNHYLSFHSKYLKKNETIFQQDKNNYHEFISYFNQKEK